MSLQRDLDIFSNFKDQESDSCRITQEGPYILKVHNRNKKSNITYGFLALVHGNELLGLPILNYLIQSILDGKIQVQSDLYFGLGNLPAAFANKRFIDEDMNRCFGKTDKNSIESQRSRELETFMLDHCDYLVDIHQTISSAQDPFFIFQYTNERCIQVMQKWNPGIPVILQQDPLGENTGLCADEYMRSRGKFGAALELGQLGTNEHFDLGMEVCKRALSLTPQKICDFPLLTLSGNYKVKDSSYKLDEGWKNLKSFKAGERLGTCDEGIVYAPVTGYMLFPRYRTVNAGQELFYYCTTHTQETRAHENREPVVELV